MDLSREIADLLRRCEADERCDEDEDGEHIVLELDEPVVFGGVLFLYCCVDFLLLC